MIYYNEIEPKKAAWLQALMDRGVIPRGDIDTRSIKEVKPHEVKHYTQRHWFAGIGIWAYALKCAGWGDRECDTGSCPCQPFSVAGKRKAKEDERHLWPTWFDLITELRPCVVFGEQVADGDGIAWLDTVQSQMESIGYRVGPCVLPASGFGAPHQRHRTFFVADASTIGKLANPTIERHERRGPGEAMPAGRHEQESERFCTAGQLEYTESERCGEAGPSGQRSEKWAGDSSELGIIGRSCNGFWHDAEWLPCTDGKARAVEPGTFPLAHGAPARILRLRGYGDGIVAPVAIEFVKAYMSVIDTVRPEA